MRQGRPGGHGAAPTPLNVHHSSGDGPGSGRVQDLGHPATPSRVTLSCLEDPNGSSASLLSNFGVEQTAHSLSHCVVLGDQCCLNVSLPAHRMSDSTSGHLKSEIENQRLGARSQSKHLRGCSPLWWAMLMSPFLR